MVSAQRWRATPRCDSTLAHGASWKPPDSYRRRRYASSLGAANDDSQGLAASAASCSLGSISSVLDVNRRTNSSGLLGDTSRQSVDRQRSARGSAILTISVYANRLC